MVNVYVEEGLTQAASLSHTPALWEEVWVFLSYLNCTFVSVFGLFGGGQ